MRKIALVLAIAVICALPGCTDKAKYSAAEKAVENTNSCQRQKVNYAVEMKIADESVTMMFSHGNYVIDRENGLMHSTSIETYIGTQSTQTQYYFDGYVYTDLDGSKTKYKGAADDVFGYLQFAKVISFKKEDISKLKVNEDGTEVSFTVKEGYKDQLWGLLGDGFYSLAKIVKPQKEKTKIGSAECVLSIKNDSEGNPILSSYKLTFPVVLYDTPAYSPNYTPPEEDYMLEITVSLSLNFTSFGEEVTFEKPNQNEYKDLS